MPRPNRGTRLSDGPNEHGCFEIQWTEAGRSRRLSTGTGNRATAEKVLAGFILQREQEAERRTKMPTMGEIIDAYEDEHIKRKAVDVERAINCGKPLRAFFGGMLPDEVTPAALEAYGAQRGIGQATLRRELGHMVAAINHALRYKRLKHDDAPYIPLPAKVEPRSYTLSEAEMMRFLSSTRGDPSKPLPRIFRFLALMIYAPARPEAVRTLTWFQVDLEQKLINYRQEGRSQTKKRRVIVPIPDGLIPILRQAREETETEFMLDHGGSIRKAFETAAKRAGFPEATPNTLRHSWATHAVARGVPPAHVAAIMGDTVETVMRNYAHLQPDHLRDAVEVWGRNARDDDDQRRTMPNIAG